MTAPAVDRVALQRAAIGKLGQDKFEWYVRGMSIEDANRGVVPFEAWPHIIETATRWGTGQSEQVLKARQLGFTWLAGGLADFRSQKKKHARTLILSKGEFESQQLLQRCKFINENQIPELRQKVRSSNKGELQFSDGGVIIALPSTENAGRGFHASLVIADEAAFHPYAAENYQAYRPAIADGGQLVLISTSNGPNGWFYEMWQGNREKEARGLRPTLKTTFVDALARPDRDREWYERERAAYIGLPQAFLAENPMTPEEAFSSLSGLVYPNFQAVRHLRPDPVPWEECVYRLFGMDLGGGDPTAVVVLGVYKDKSSGLLKVHVYDLFYKDDGPASIEELFRFLTKWDAKKRFTIGAGDFAPGGATVSASLANMGLPVRNTVATRKEGIDLVYMYLEQNWLSFRQTNIIERVYLREFSSYRWADKMDPHSHDRYKTKTPTDNHGDALDALRGAILLAYRYCWTDMAGGGVKMGEVKWS